MTRVSNIILQAVARGVIPFAALFALYVQVHGKVSAGGGFQAGVILAACLLLYGLAYGKAAMQKAWPYDWLKIGACMGVMVYAGVGLVTMLMGGKFLDYDVLGQTGPEGQFYGIFLVELGVGITVFSVTLLLYYLFADRGEHS